MLAGKENVLSRPATLAAVIAAMVAGVIQRHRFSATVVGDSRSGGGSALPRRGDKLFALVAAALTATAISASSLATVAKVRVECLLAPSRGGVLLLGETWSAEQRERERAGEAAGGGRAWLARSDSGPVL